EELPGDQPVPLQEEPGHGQGLGARAFVLGPSRRGGWDSEGDPQGPAWGHPFRARHWRPRQQAPAARGQGPPAALVPAQPLPDAAAGRQPGGTPAREAGPGGGQPRGGRRWRCGGRPLLARWRLLPEPEGLQAVVGHPALAGQGPKGRLQPLGTDPRQVFQELIPKEGPPGLEESQYLAFQAAGRRGRPGPDPRHLPPAIPLEEGAGGQAAHLTAHPEPVPRAEEVLQPGPEEARGKGRQAGPEDRLPEGWGEKPPLEG